MKRLIVRWRDGFANIPATRLNNIEGFVYAYRNNELVGIFDLGCVDLIYLSETGQGDAES